MRTIKVVRINAYQFVVFEDGAEGVILTSNEFLNIFPSLFEWQYLNVFESEFGETVEIKTK